MRHVLSLLPVLAVTGCAWLPTSGTVRPLYEGQGAFDSGVTSFSVFDTATLPERDVGWEMAGENGGGSDEGRSVLTSILLYVPNRIVDAFDVVRVGVNVGPGLGVQLTPTQFAQVSAMSRLAVGAGLQTLRHLPIHAATDNAYGVGLLTADPSAGLTWFTSVPDLRFEVHLVLVGAHAALEPVEVVDLVAGFLFLDLKGDDF